jgi:RNA 2',3'-cyclic 3'-phosphodiesterase
MPQLIAGSRKPFTDRLFFAIFPDLQTAERIAQLADQLCTENRVEGKPLPAGQLHVTLDFLGNYAGLPKDKIAMASAAAATVAMPGFEVAFDRVASFPGNRRSQPLVLLGNDGVVALTSLQRTLRQALDAAGLPAASKGGYKPHVTVLYGKRGLPKQAIQPVGWTAREFALVHSRIGLRQYATLGRWSLEM